MKIPALVLAVIVVIVMLAPQGVFAAEGHAEPHHHHLALFAGFGTESKNGHEDENGYAIGLEYEFRWNRHWGVGAVVEGLGKETVRNVLLVVPISFHPGGGWRLVIGPGVEITPKKDKLAVRLGAGYIFHIGKSWGLAPEVFLDLIETGEQTWVAGVALGYGF